MTNAQKGILSVLSALACAVSLVILAIGTQMYRDWTLRPLGPTLSYPTELRMPATWTASPPATQLTPGVTPSPVVAFLTGTPTSPFVACGELPTLIVMAMGTDVRPGQRRHGLTDVMRAIRLDFRARRVTTLEFPRDLWVRIPGIEQNLRTDRQKLNTAYAYGGPERGPGLLAHTLHLNFGLDVDHYIVANMNVFAEIVDALGGIDVTIPAGGIDGRTETDRSARLVFPQGPQHLNGEQALTLARMRNVSVFARAEHQNMVLCALRKKVESPETLLRLPAIIDSFMSNIQTDLTPELIRQIACLGTQMPRSGLLFATFPRELFRSGEAYDAVLEQDVFIWEADFDALRGYVAAFQAGTWPSPAAPSTSATESSGCG